MTMRLAGVFGVASMNSVIKAKQGELDALCRRYHVQKLEVFGSATGDSFDVQNSDVDILVVFEPCSPSEHYEQYFGLLESLETLFDRSVDLVEANAMRNPYFTRSVNETRMQIYAA